MSNLVNAAEVNGRIGAGSLILNDYKLKISDIEGGHRLSVERGADVQTMDVMDGGNPFETNTGTFLIEWDGNGAGLPNVAMDGLTFYKVSNDVVTEDELVGLTIEVVSDDEVVTFTLDEAAVEELKERGMITDFAMRLEALLFIYDCTNEEIQSMRFTSNGTWLGVYKEDNTQFYVRKISTPHKKILKLDEKHIPDSIARKSDIPPQVYSKGEQRIGTWINGKPIYRKTLVYINNGMQRSGDSDPTPSNGWVNLGRNGELEMLNIEQYTNVYGICETYKTDASVGRMMDAEHVWQMIPRVVPDGMAEYAIGLGDLTPTGIKVLFGSAYTYADIYLTIEYTKTTD